MNKLKIKARQQDTYRQTFCFGDPPLQHKQQANYNRYKFISCKNGDPISHHIINSQTQQQINHRKHLYLKNQQNRLLDRQSKRVQNSRNQIFHPVRHAESRCRKLSDLKGQLQVLGTNNFLKQQFDQGNNIYKQKLLETDCSFIHTCHDHNSKQNQYAIYNKGNISKQLKNVYDLGHEGSCRQQYRNLINGQNRLFVFQEKVKPNKNKK